MDKKSVRNALPKFAKDVKDIEWKLSLLESM
jgi:hypothetical protein